MVPVELGACCVVFLLCRLPVELGSLLCRVPVELGASCVVFLLCWVPVELGAC